MGTDGQSRRGPRYRPQSRGPPRTLAVLDARERVRAAAQRSGSTTLAQLLRGAGLPRGGVARLRASPD